MFNPFKLFVMGILEDFEQFYEEEKNSVDVPTINVYDPDYIKERIRVIKNNPRRNRFRICDKVKCSVRLTGLDNITHEPINVTDCYLLGELCMTRHPQFYTKPIKTKNYIIFEDEAVISGARNYVVNQYVEVEIMYRILDTSERQWFRVEKIEL